MPFSVIGLGAGGHAKVILEVLREETRYKVVGLLDPKGTLKGKELLGIPILGDDSLLPGLVKEGVRHFFVGVGSIGKDGDRSTRRRLFEAATSQGMTPITLVHPRATVSPSAQLGEGTVVLANAVVNASTVVGKNVIINTGAVVEHDCLIGDHAHIASRACLASTVTVGEEAHVGAGATVRQSLQIGKGAVVGAGAVVVTPIPPKSVFVGNPARPLLKKVSC